MSSILIAGATGLVGGEALRLALEDPRIERVVAPTRRAIGAVHRKLENPIVIFERLPIDARWWAVDGAICALGTTRAKATSAATNRAVDFGYPLALARLMRDHGAQRFALTSSMGADARSRFLYTRIKGELEDALYALGFPSLTLVRPGLIGGDREEFRLAERVAGLVLRVTGPLLPPRYRVCPVSQIARVLLDSAINGAPGRLIVEADRLQQSDASLRRLRT